MTRIKGGLLHMKKRRGILKLTKGYRWGRKSKIKVAKVAKMKAGAHAYKSRRNKKRINRGMWNIRINAAAHKLGMKYSEVISKLKKKEIVLDRKILAEIALKQPTIFAKILDSLK